MLLQGQYLETAANGHLTLNWPTAGRLSYTLLCWRLQFRHGFRRAGDQIAGYGEVIFPAFVRGGLRLLSGWDNWSGYYLLSEDEAGDEFLKLLAPR
jgi:hypothetical protein